MQQIVNITQARNNLSRLVAEVSAKNKTVVIVRNSFPEAVLMPYKMILSQEEEKERLWKITFEKLLPEGKKAGRLWAKKKKIDLSKLTEEEIYELVGKA